MTDNDLTDGCDLVAFLRAAGPARVPLKTCCVVALIERGFAADSPQPACVSALPTAEPAPAGAGTASARSQVGASAAVAVGAASLRAEVGASAPAAVGAPSGWPEVATSVSVAVVP